MPYIEVSGLTKSYGSIVGVRDLDFTVEQGEIFGFLGPNGAGKTTAIRLLMQLLNPDKGSISLFGKLLNKNRWDLRDRIGYLPGDFHPYGDMTSGYFLNYMAGYRSSSPRLRSWLFDKLHFTARELKQRIKILSHGNRQKLGIVLALEHEPDLAILDEPTLGLDPLMQEAFYEILRELQMKGKTIFLSSHILTEVEKVCHRVAIIREGTLVALESLSDLKKKRPRRLIVELREGPSTGPPSLPGTQLIGRAGNRYVFLIEGEIQAVLRSLAALPVQDVILPEPGLEDIFIGFYHAKNL
jgi:ABC-2 type transport system ATP-binding protein